MTLSAHSGSTADYRLHMLTETIPRTAPLDPKMQILNCIYSESRPEMSAVLRLCRVLVSCDPKLDSGFMLEAISALELWREPAAEPYVQTIADSWAVWKMARPIRSRARQCLEALKAEQRRRVDSGTLLRSAELPQERMVRPAISAFAEWRLVRPLL